MDLNRPLLWLLVVLAPRAATGEELRVVSSEPIFTAAPFPSSHASTLVEVDNGALLAAWFGGTDEGEPDVAIWLARREPGSRWSDPVEVADGVTGDTRHPTWNPVLFRPAPAATGEAPPLLLFYKVGPTPASWWGMLRRSHDSGRTWSPAERLPDGILGPVRSKPLELADGALLCGSSTEHDGWRVHFEITPDWGRTWRRTGEVVHRRDGASAPFSAIQPTLLRSPADPRGPVRALCRTRDGAIAETVSEDDGDTWSPLRATALPNPSAGIEAVSLDDGRFLLVYNPTTAGPGSRSRLAVALSDDGREWRQALLLEDQPGEYSYPAAIQASDGQVHVTYTWRRQRIQHLVLHVVPHVVPSQVR
jgi:predicted neuraminidase